MKSRVQLYDYYLRIGKCLSVISKSVKLAPCHDNVDANSVKTVEYQTTAEPVFSLQKQRWSRPCVLTEHHALKAYWGGGCIYSSHALLTSGLDGGKWSASHPSRFTSKERVIGSYWIGDLVGPRAGLDAEVKRKIPNPCWDANSRSSCT
jgi:hypothetical protein